MNKWKIDDNLYLVERYDINPESTKGFVHRYITTMDIVCAITQIHDWLIKEELYIALLNLGYWDKFKRQICHDRERILYDADMPRIDLKLPVLCLEYNMILNGGY